MQTLYSQHPYRCKLEWGRHGAKMAAERGDILVVVDTISFSTATVTAIQHGGIIYPARMDEDMNALAQHTGAELAVSRREVPAKGRFSLSPVTFTAIEPGTRVILASPNGATCSRYAAQVPYLFVSTLVNAQAVASVVSSLLQEHPQQAVTVLACGERWHPSTEDGELRFAIEDYLGAGAILSYLTEEKSPEALVCAGAFLQSRDTLDTILWECASGRELREKGFGVDVEHASRLNVYDVVPYMHDGYLRAWQQETG